MKFRTEYIASASHHQLDIDHPIAMLGSCFSEYMQDHLRRYLWHAANSCGVLFNPLSIARVVNMLDLTEDRLDHELRDSLFKSGDMWHSWLADSSFSGTTPEDVVAKMKTALEELDTILTKGKTLVVTFGTAWCYFQKSDRPEESDAVSKCDDAECLDTVVANCHKQPQSMFCRRRVDTQTITDIWSDTLRRLCGRYPGLRVIFTVSPVRHVRDGFAENTRSKATLILAVDELCREIGCCEYFPAFEIVTDDLRDYRFYGPDLVHPSEQAVDYILEKFFDTFVAKTEREVLRRGEEIFRRLQHRPINPSSKAAKEFSEESLRLYRQFMDLHPRAAKL